MKKFLLTLACIVVTCLLYVVPSLIMYEVMGKTACIITAVVVLVLHMIVIIGSYGETPEMEWESENRGLYFEVSAVLTFFTIIAVVVIIFLQQVWSHVEFLAGNGSYLLPFFHFLY